MLVDPKEIKIPSDRQRGEISQEAIDSLAASIERIGQIHAITVRHSSDGLELVVGETRLRACLKLNRQVEISLKAPSDLESKVMELEENVKRSDLEWRREAKAYGDLHRLYSELHPDWSVEKTAECLSVKDRWVYTVLTVYKNLNNTALNDCSGIKHAYSVLQSIANRQTVQLVGSIADVGLNLFTPTPAPASDSKIPEISPSDTGPGLSDSIPDNNVPICLDRDEIKQVSVEDRKLAEPLRPAIIQADFISWISTYAGPKFNLIHIDFPYDAQWDSYSLSVSGTKDLDYKGSGSYWQLLEALTTNLDRIASYQSHIMFWFSMEHYQDTLNKLEAVGLFVIKKPLIWFKSDNAGIIPSGGIYPRNVYETAFLCSRGKRPVSKGLANVYSAPTPANPIHPSQKSEPMLRHFFSMLVDNTTDFLDPTCGSGAAVLAADSLGTRSVLGLDLSQSYVDVALAALNTARTLRRITR